MKTKQPLRKFRFVNEEAYDTYGKDQKWKQERARRKNRRDIKRFIDEEDED